MQDSGVPVAVSREGAGVLEHCQTSVSPSKADGKCMGLFYFFCQVIHFQIGPLKRTANALQCTLAHYYYQGVASGRLIITTVKAQICCIFVQTWVKCDDCLGKEIMKEGILDQTQFLCLLNMKYFGSLFFRVSVCLFFLKLTLNFHLDHFVCFSVLQHIKTK